MPKALHRGTSASPARPAANIFEAGALDGRAWSGKVEISPRAIATIAGRAVAQCYGVVGVADRRLRFGRVELTPPGEYARGVDVRFAEGRIVVDVYVVLEYGLRISEVAQSVMDTVKFAVESALGARVTPVNVNVNVQALRVQAER
ncbi:MAG TPA: Asp23/Gls24 family envelope stress response protein [Ktedonobacterales bacterium]